jgi:hypothetical protein
MMGLYINPTGKPVGQWLDENGEKITLDKTIVGGYARWHLTNVFMSNIKQGRVLACLVDNESFKYAAIAFDLREAERLQNGTRSRPYQWYIVPIKNLHNDAGVPSNALGADGLLGRIETAQWAGEVHEYRNSDYQIPLGKLGTSYRTGGRSQLSTSGT